MRGFANCDIGMIDARVTILRICERIAAVLSSLQSPMILRLTVLPEVNSSEISAQCWGSAVTFSDVKIFLRFRMMKYQFF